MNTTITLLDELRAKTNPLHKQLEQSRISLQIMSPEVTLKDYEEYLQKVLVLHQSAEEKIFPFVNSLVLDLPLRVKSSYIRKDMENLSIAENNSLPNFFDERFLPSEAFCMGLMYVTEGSTLGGLYIQKNLLGVLGDTVKNATGFLNVYGQHTGSYWKSFLNNMEVFQMHKDQKLKDEIIRGAMYGFERTGVVFNSGVAQCA